MSQKEIEESLTLLKKNWEVDPILQQFMLGKITNVLDYPIKVKDVIFHIPFLNSEKNIFYGNVFGLIVITAVIDKVDYL